MISLSLDVKIMISSHIISRHFYFFSKYDFWVDIKSMPKYGYERDLGLGSRLLRGSKQNCRS
jgi:hypothetical protein